MTAYPSLEEAFPDTEPDRLVCLNHTENRRSAIAQAEGLEMLAISDQYVRAICELGVNNPMDAGAAHHAIEAALASFQIRGFPSGHSPTPVQITKAIKRIAKSMEHIEQDLSLLMMARRGIGIGESNRADSLAQLQHAILGSIAASILPSSLTSKFTYDDIADTMPGITQTVDQSGFTNAWSGGFAKVAHTANALSNDFTTFDLAKPTRVHDIYLSRFIGQLGSIFERWTGQVPHSPDRNANQSNDWRGPFSRFVEAVWPLTPEGLGALGTQRRCPTNKQIREALKQSVLLPHSSTT